MGKKLFTFIIDSPWCLKHILPNNCRKFFYIFKGYSFHEVGERVGWGLMKYLCFVYSRDFIQVSVHQTYVGLFLLLVVRQYFKVMIYYWLYLGSFFFMFTFSYLYLFQLESLITIKMVIG